MYGEKLLQAKNAASYIIRNLNEGDRFNIVDFETNVYSFRASHVPFTQANMDSALDYISDITDMSLTNISGAFETAISQFSETEEDAAKIIIFLTDGQPTVGLINTEEILNSIDNLVNGIDTTITIFNFGIGADVNRQLLTLIAKNNNGLCEFLENNELEESITNFYRKIRNPVLINTRISFSPQVVFEACPDPLPNLYKGQQLIVTGKYNEAAALSVTLSGTAFGQPVSYEFQKQLSDTTDLSCLFLTKIWAKQKIENLLVRYYSYPETSSEAAGLKDEIIEISLKYGVISPFTSFTNPTGVEEIMENKKDFVQLSNFRLLGNYPNPFNPSTKIRFEILDNFRDDLVILRIYNSIGQLIRTIVVTINGQGLYEILWDGRMDNGQAATSGHYIYILDFGNTILSGKMTLIK
jgi:Ca-activated chloride channel family protein